ncbi:MAG: hypothetical protein A2Y62_14495 [Candidatus Fischerbacteria bacterium RBG_13_37_8]|uniref:Radical SAM core domain-containing protein n=1 Tax=Candidatus Fischerbacteria bacterium RBG_13_37_8 TaxID=1817863 RepID=A0A1F5VNN0_9BACT|nr:MAG: hypothetical protein A2Y62_14495 [Candidatus Fischerbacteria bacterium RBG_13_37_8]
MTKSICPQCKEVVPGQIVYKDDKVFLARTCPQHGEFLGLIYTGVEAYENALNITKPPQLPRKLFVPEFTGCPESCGLCPEHKQHTCMPIIEITDHCNMSCPVCLARNKSSYFMPHSKFSAIIDNLLEAEEQFELITISGGEPTLHPDLLELIEAAQRPEIITISLSTNGRIFLQNEALLDKLIKKNVFLSLQFDGFDEAAYRLMRGQEMLEEKLQILTLLEQHGASVSLVMTVMNGINNKEIGNVMRYFLEKDFIHSLMIQPIAFVNPVVPYDSARVMTIPHIAREIAAGSGGILHESDIINVPCSHPVCFAGTYLLKLDTGEFVPLPRLVEINDYLDIIKNRSMPGLENESFEKIRDAIYNIWSITGIQPESKKILAKLKNILCEVDKCGTHAMPQELFKAAYKKLKSIFIHNFMDAYSFDFDRIMKCCNHYPIGEKWLVPCCVHNNLMRWK